MGYQNGKKRSVHTNDVQKARQIIGFFTENQVQEITESAHSKSFHNIGYFSHYSSHEYFNKRTYTPETVPKLEVFFNSENYSLEEKEKIEKILIFGIFTQAIWDLISRLNQSSEASINKITDSPKQIVRDYLSILNNISYKCRPDVYRSLSLSVSFLAFLGISLALAIGFFTMFHLPLALIAGVTSTAQIVCLALSAAVVFIITLAVLGSSQMRIVYNENIAEDWNPNWAYRIPECATEVEPKTFPNTPTDFGIIGPRGTSFKIMNRLGFFPFKETAIKAMEITETFEKNLAFICK